MKKSYEYIQFEEIESPPTNKTKKFSCMNIKSGIELGMVRWHGAWRQYCYFPTIQAVYSEGCLKDICDFIAMLKESGDEAKAG